jgi:hypothetical protein
VRVVDTPATGQLSLAERLGFDADSRLVILSCDDLGACHASNVGVLQALHDGAATCASLMVPAPWACQAANALTADDDIGVHLTLNCEHSCYPRKGCADGPTPACAVPVRQSPWRTNAAHSAGGAPRSRAASWASRRAVAGVAPATRIRR